MREQQHPAVVFDRLAASQSHEGANVTTSVFGGTVGDAGVVNRH